jgi:hypothetical protein
VPGSAEAEEARDREDDHDQADDVDDAVHSDLLRGNDTASTAWCAVGSVSLFGHYGDHAYFPILSACR